MKIYLPCKIQSNFFSNKKMSFEASAYRFPLKRMGCKEDHIALRNEIRFLNSYFIVLSTFLQEPIYKFLLIRMSRTNEYSIKIFNSI